MDTSFSHTTRETDLKAMASQTVDLLVIGGGIAGASIARDAARRGIRTALIDRGDFAGGTSGRTSRLIHGGIPHVHHRAWRSVFHEASERRLLVRLAPHLVRPLPFLLPFYTSDRWPAWRALAGLTLYDLLSLFQNVRAHRPLGKRAVLRREPNLRPHGLRGGAIYWAASCDDARLTLATARDARMAGALVANYAAVTGFDKAGQRITGANVRDELSGKTFTLRAFRFVAAAGPWVDEIRMLDDPASTPLTQLTRESHVVVPSHRLGIDAPVTVTSPIDGRTILIAPDMEIATIGGAGSTLAGSPETARATAEDVLYLLRSANALFPAARLTTHDVISTWCGVRVEPRDRSDADDRGSSANHIVEERSSGLLVVAGTEIGVARATAERVTDRIVRALTAIDGRPRPRGCTTAAAALPGGEVADLDLFTREMTAAGAPADLAAHLVATYGTEAPAVLRLIERDRSLGSWIVPGLPVVWAEVDHAVQREMAMALDDVLVRRTPLLRHDPHHALQQAPEVARRLGEALAWSADRQRTELARYRDIARATIAFVGEFDDPRPA